ncbi:hypothetical protein [Providencia phage PSTCR6]|nr:hypothetical protein [Providencia phage PSTCR6]
MNYIKALSKAKQGLIVRRMYSNVTMQYDFLNGMIVFYINGKKEPICRFSDKLATDWEVVDPDLMDIKWAPIVGFGSSKIEIGGVVYA